MASFKAGLVLLLLLTPAFAAFDPVPLTSLKQNDSMQTCVVDYNSCLSKACSLRGGSPNMTENATGYTFRCYFNGSADDTAFYGGDRWGDVYDCRQALVDCAINKNPGILTKVCSPSFILALLLILAINRQNP